MKNVDSFAALSDEHFGDGVRAARFPRQISGDFEKVARNLLSQSKFSQSRDVHHYTADEVRHYAQDRLKPSLMNMFRVSAGERTALDIMVRDIDDLERHGYDYYLLRIVGESGYENKDITTFHCDGNPADPETHHRVILSCYHGPVTEFIDNADAIYMGNSLYRAKPGATIHRFNNGDIWTQSPANTARAEAFIHRGPPVNTLRMLLTAARPM
ncbi:hypothetical protein [Micavibrio aeruginosavorus]|uniref:hypothetical protein n=1 Tax=Micavibrio aeruginosavorus TaxID=349221 RepID=UPI003F4AB445